MRSTEPSVEARVAAKWWADQMRNGFEHDNGDTGQSGMANMVTARISFPPAEQIDAFEAELAQRMQAELDDPRSTTYFFALKFSTDYGPSTGLADAMEAAGIKPNGLFLPMKTAMWAEPGSVRVGAGYRAEPQELDLEAQ